MARGSGNKNGRNWVRLSTRMAIYHQDGWRCLHCGFDLASRTDLLTLDHLMGRTTNNPLSLVVACVVCNSRRGKRIIRPTAFHAALRAKLPREVGRELARQYAAIPPVGGRRKWKAVPDMSAVGGVRIVAVR